MAEVKYCPNCGKPIEENVNFCPFCGTEIDVRLYNKLKKPGINIKFDVVLTLKRQGKKC